MKGASALIASVMLVLIAIAAASFVSGWLTSTTEKEATLIKNSTKQQLECQYADLYVREAFYNCANSCNAGTAHVVNVTVVNAGKKAISIDRIAAVNTTGSVFEFSLPSAKTLQVGDIIYLDHNNTESCSGLNRSIEYIRVAGINCPNAYDNFDGSRVTFQNC